MSNFHNLPIWEPMWPDYKNRDMYPMERDDVSRMWTMFPSHAEVANFDTGDIDREVLYKDCPDYDPTHPTIGEYGEALCDCGVVEGYRVWVLDNSCEGGTCPPLFIRWKE